MDQIGAAQSAAPPPVPTELRNYARFVGPDPLDCGQHLITTPFVTAGEEELQRSVACASDAAEDRNAFWTIKQHQGIDSLIFHGLLGSQDGKVYRFLYDSAPCGGPGCAGRFSVERCDKPVAVKRGNVAEFAYKPSLQRPKERLFSTSGSCTWFTRGGGPTKAAAVASFPNRPREAL